MVVATVAALDAAEPGEPLVEPVVERLAQLRRRILLVRQRQAHRREVRRLDAEIEPVERRGSCAS